MAGAYPHLRFSKEIPLTPRRGNGFGKQVKCSNPRAHGEKLKNQFNAVKNTILSQFGGHDSRNIMKIRLSENVNIDNIVQHGLSIIGRQNDTAYLVFGSEQQFNLFNSRLAKLSSGEYITYASLLYAIDKIDSWTEEDRKSWAVKNIGIPESGKFRLDVELWPLGKLSSQERDKLLKDFIEWLRQESITEIDRVNRDSLVLFRIELTRPQAHKIFNHKDVRQVDLLPRTGVEYSQLNIDLNILPERFDAVPESASSICILDSGINTNHPLLQGAVGDAQSFILSEDSSDFSGHGTAVAGVALFGNLEERIDSNEWSRELTILSGKVLSVDDAGQTVFDEKTIESTLTDAIQYFYREYGCKIYNLSLGNLNAPFKNSHISGIAVTLDELVRELDILITVSSGNFTGSDIINNWRDDYPNYLLSDDANLIDPAPAVNVLTIGSFAKHTLTYTERRYQTQGEINEIHVANEGQVSPFSRSCQKEKSAFKPELLAHGGNYAIPIRQEGKGWQQVSKYLGVVTLNHQPQGRTLLSEFSGTSFSAPYIAHLAGRLLNSYPNISSNLMRALLVNHANLPSAVASTFNDKKHARRVAGYGVIDEDSLFKSSEEHVVLISEEEIENDKHQFFELPIPDSYFRKGKARRTITISLAYSPAVRTTRIEYIATKIKFHLINAASLQEATEAFNNDNKDDIDSIPECDGVKRDVTQEDRSRGTLQSSTWTFNQFNKPRKLFLVVTRQDQPWAQHLVRESEKYAVAVSVTDRENENARLYTQIKQQVEDKLRVRQRAKTI